METGRRPVRRLWARGQCHMDMFTRNSVNNAPMSWSDLSSPRLPATPSDQCIGQGHYPTPVESGLSQPLYDPAKVHVLNRDRESTGFVRTCQAGQPPSDDFSLCKTEHSTGHPGLLSLSLSSNPLAQLFREQGTQEAPAHPVRGDGCPRYSKASSTEQTSIHPVPLFYRLFYD